MDNTKLKVKELSTSELLVVKGGKRRSSNRGRRRKTWNSFMSGLIYLNDELK